MDWKRVLLYALQRIIYYLRGSRNKEQSNTPICFVSVHIVLFLTRRDACARKNEKDDLRASCINFASYLLCLCLVDDVDHLHSALWAR